MLHHFLLSALLFVGGEPTSREPPAVPAFDVSGLPEGATARFGSDFFRATSNLQSLHFDMNGKELHGWDETTLYRWDFPSGRPLEHLRLPVGTHPLRRPFAQITLANGHYRVSWITFAANKEALHAWDLKQGKLIFSRDVTLDNSDNYMHLAWSLDGKRLITVTEHGQIDIYDDQGKHLEGMLADRNANTWDSCEVDATFSNLLMLEGHRGDKSVAVVEVKTGKKRWSIEASRWSEIRFSPDGKQVFGRRGGEKEYEVFEVISGRELRARKRNWNKTWYDGKPVFSPDGKRIFEFRRDSIVVVDLESGKEDRVATPLSSVPQRLATFSADGRYVALHAAERVMIWDTRTQKELPATAGFPAMREMHLSVGGQRLIFRGVPIDFQADKWESFDIAKKTIRKLSIDNNETMPRVVVTGGFTATDEFVGVINRTWNRWDVKSARCLDFARLPNDFYHCVLDPTRGELLEFKQRKSAEGQFQTDWRIWNLASNKASDWQMTTLKEAREVVSLPGQRFLCFGIPIDQPDEVTKLGATITIVASGASHLFLGRTDRPESWRPLDFGGNVRPGDSERNHVLGHSRRGQLVLVGTQSSTNVPIARHTLRGFTDPASFRHSIIEIDSGESAVDRGALLKAIGGGPAQLSPDGRYVVIGGLNNLQIYEPYSLRRVVKKIPLPASPRIFAFSPDGRFMVCQLEDTTVMSWDESRLRHWVDEAIRLNDRADLISLIDALAGESVIALRAARLLAAAGDEGLAALRRSIRGVKPDLDEVKKLIGALDDPRFAVRQKAESDLAAWGNLIESQMKEALAKATGAESKERLQRLLTGVAKKPYRAIALKQSRAIQVLEWNATPAARKLIEEWAEEFPDTPLGANAKSALTYWPK